MRSAVFGRQEVRYSLSNGFDFSSQDVLLFLSRIFTMRNPFAKAARVAPEDVAEPRPMKNVVDELPAGSDTIAKRPSMAQDESKSAPLAVLGSSNC